MNSLSKNNLRGPIMIFGAGGFIGTNLLLSLLSNRKDVIGISHNLENNPRLSAAKIPREYLYQCDITDHNELKKLIQTHKPQTIFNLAAYGSYPFQSDIDKIYSVNVNASIRLIELLKKYHFHAYISAGSQSEYGHNNAGPQEAAELFPNSHYALSKTAVSYAMKYYGKVEKLPVFHLRLYSAYGPWEEPTRLIPTLITYALKESFPELVDEHISRDFIYITDIINALLCTAKHKNKELYGETFNIGTGKKTTIKQLVYLIKDLLHLKTEPKFGTMTKRKWDTSTDWYANTIKSNTLLGWSAKIGLIEGLKKTLLWHNYLHHEKNNLFDHFTNIQSRGSHRNID